MSELKPNRPDGGWEPNKGKPQQQAGGQIGKDTDGDGRVVQPGRKPGEIDGDLQKRKQKQNQH